MQENRPSVRDRDELPDVEIEQRRKISLVWLVPLVAGAIAIWLGYTTLSERGPTVTIRFETAEGLEAGKTQVKYKEVAVGVVDNVELSEDLSHILVTAELSKGVAQHVTEGTRFWIVRPRIGATGVSGLGTLLSGAYVEMDPGEGAPADSFTGLEEPPPISSDVPGTKYVLKAESLGWVERGSPVYFRDVQVGQVLSYQIADDERALEVQVFVNAPHDQLIRADSRFWNASGIELSATATGFDVRVQSLAALLAGGIAFDTPSIARPGEPAAAGAEFPLFESFASVGEAQFTEKIPYLVSFDGSVRGLSPGAPVEFRGIKIGRVTDVSLLAEPKTGRVRIPVMIEIEPQRVGMEGDMSDVEPFQMMAALVDRGLRAQLKQGNLLTGELFVSLDFHPDAPKAKLDMNAEHPVIPSIPTDIEVLTASVTGVLDKLASLPLEDLVVDLRSTVQSIDALASSADTGQTVAALSEASVGLQALVAKLDEQLGPLLSQARSTLAAAEGLVGANSQTRYDVSAMLRELTSAARSIRVFADYLERHPEALIRGKAGYDGR
jgi:paraquat-inducible protein B